MTPTIVGRVYPAVAMSLPKRLLASVTPPTLQSVLLGLQKPIAHLEQIVDGYEIRLRDMHELHTGEASMDYTLNSDRERMLTEMTLASEVLIQLRAAVATGKEVLS